MDAPAIELSYIFLPHVPFSFSQAQKNTKNEQKSTKKIHRVTNVLLQNQPA